MDMPGGYGMATIEAHAKTDTDTSVHHALLTGELGATETEIDGYVFTEADRLPLPAPPEQLCIPLTLAGSATVDEVPLSTSTIARVPAGTNGRLAVDGGTVVVISASTEPVTDAAPTTVDLDACAYSIPETSDIPTARLTAPLGCTGMKVNARRLEPDQRVPAHTEGTQEEVFVPLSGPCAMRIAGEGYETPPGTIVRVAPEVIRSAVNEGDEDARWIMVGAPPTGGPEEWDPGAVIVD